MSSVLVVLVDETGPLDSFVSPSLPETREEMRTLCQRIWPARELADAALVSPTNPTNYAASGEVLLVRIAGTHELPAAPVKTEKPKAKTVPYDNAGEWQDVPLSEWRADPGTLGVRTRERIGQNHMMMLGSVAISAEAGRCGRCSGARMIFINVGGRTVCASCAGMAK